MRFLFVLIFLITLAQAQDIKITKKMSKPQSYEEISFQVDKGKWMYIKKSNFFENDPQPNLGELILAKTQSQEIKIKQDYQELVNSLVKAQKKLSEAGIHWNDLNPKASHDPYISVGEFNLYYGNELYTKAQDIISELQKWRWKVHNGAFFSKKDLKILLIQDGKTQSTKPFQTALQCKDEKFPTVCHVKGIEGQVYIK